MRAKERRTNRRRLRSFSSFKTGHLCQRVLWSLHPFLFPIDLDISQTLLHISLQKQIKDMPAYVPRHPHQPWHSAWWDPCSSYGWTKSPVKRDQVWQVVGSIEVDKGLPIHLSRRVVDYCHFDCDYIIIYYLPGDVVFLRGILNFQWSEPPFHWWKHEITHH